VLVLVSGDETAAWITHWPRPALAQDGLDAWRCSLFRNEGPARSSALIELAMAATLGWWAEARPGSTWWTGLPADGWVTWVDPRRIRSPNRGWCFQRAGWTPPPTRPAVVLDPFGGTGTTVMAARALGRVGIGVDLRWDYCRAARWRSFDPAPAAKTHARTWAERQGGLFDPRGGDR
jgi:hypothetical protein